MSTQRHAQPPRSSLKPAFLTNPHLNPADPHTLQTIDHVDSACRLRACCQGVKHRGMVVAQVQVAVEGIL